MKTKFKLDEDYLVKLPSPRIYIIKFRCSKANHNFKLALKRGRYAGLNRNFKFEIL